MKYWFCLIISISLILSNCTKNNNVELVEKINFEENNYEQAISESKKVSIKMYVNSVGGLHVRDIPNINGERIALLDDGTEILVKKEDESNVIIDGIDGKWVFVEYNNVAGWVFNGYLTDSKTTANNFDVETPEEVLNTIDSVADFIFNKNFKLKGKYFNLQDVASSLSNYRLIRQDTYESIHGGFYTEYIIEGDNYTIEVRDIHGSNDGFKIYPIKFAVNKSNFLKLFLYQTIDEYLTADDFGEINKINDGSIEYTLDYDTCVLRFNNSFLESIEYWYYMP